MHYNIMTAGSRDRPPMLATGRYAQWKCILEGPYTPSTVIIPAVPATDNSPVVPERTTVETVVNVSPENKAHFESEKEVIHLILTGIGDEIYSTVDAFWKIHLSQWRNNGVILQARITCIMNERFVTIVKQQHKLDEVSYHKLLDTLKQYQKEVNELHAERIAKNANPLARVATAQPYQDPYYQAPKPHKSYAPTSKASLLTKSHATTRNKGKEIAKPITPPSESATKDSDPEQAQKDKEMQKNLALIAKYFKKIYKPTNNNLRTSSNTRNKNVDTTPRYKNDNQTGQFGNQRTMTVAGAREDVGGQVRQQSGIQCFNCKEFGHFSKKCRKPKRVKDSMYHKEKMLLCKQAKKGVQLQAEQSDWLADTDEKIDEQELEAHYSYMAKIQEVPTADSGTDSEPLEQDDSNVIPDSPDMCDNDIQNDQNVVECDDKCVALANLIANLKRDINENKKIQKQLKKANTTLAHELTECKSILAETSRTLGESNSIWDSCLVALQNKQTEFERYKNLNDCTIDYEKLEHKLNETLGLLAHKDTDIKEGLAKEKTKVIKYLKLKEEKDIDKMISMEKQLKELVDQAWVKHSKDHFRAPTAHDMEILIKTCLMPLALKTQNDSFVFVHELKQEMHADLKYVESLEKEIDELESDKAEFSNMYDMLLQECVTMDLFKECECLAQKLSKQTEFVSKEVYTELLRSFAKLEKHSISLELALQQCQEQLKNDTVCKEKASNVFLKEREQYFEIQDLKAKLKDKDIAIYSLERKHFSKTKSVPKTNVSEGLSKTVIAQNLPQTARQAVRNINVIKLGMYRIDTMTTQTRSPQLPQTFRNTNHRVSTSNGVNHRTNVSIPQLKSIKMKENVMPNTSQVKFKKTEVEDHHRISSISNQSKTKKPKIVQLILFIIDSGCTKHITGNLSLMCNFVEKYMGTVCFGTDQFDPILGYRDLVQGNIMINRVYYVKGLNHNLFSVGQFCDADLEVAFRKSTCFVRDLQGNDLLTGNCGSDLYTISLQETNSSTPICLMAKASPTQAWL
ncbi:retrovirus-related pol polyprotein from transposon TNT 1-94 [Tanacetum coccineum]|uniref:Retrovirus-related pol polyprotein from transposon TNT 1-94 n=1 Tax=Tanacetum coccineum TaxID=301880 RepID=A0ABQ5F3X1_9ASTR